MLCKCTIYRKACLCLGALLYFSDSRSVTLMIADTKTFNLIIHLICIDDVS